VRHFSVSTTPNFCLLDRESLRGAVEAYRNYVTEQQPYEVVRQGRGYELRRYPSCVVAEVAVDADFDQAGSIAFRPLVNYIGGNNSARTSLDMTAPVVQSRKMSMTAPVVQQVGEDREQVIAFVLPANVALESAPTPNDPRVVVREVPASLTAVSRFSGRWSEASYLQHVQELQSAIAADGLTPISEPRFARFDPPFKPWFLRRNEVHIDVEDHG